MSRKRALICGVSGQDGAYLARLLLRQGYDVFGASRDAQAATFGNLKQLAIHADIRLLSVAISDFRSVLQALMKVKPDEVYNLAGQSSVGLSFDQPVETMESIGIGTLNLLEAIRFANRDIKLYSAGSSECFGNTNHMRADESTAFRPRSPYAAAKAAAYWQVANYREAYGLFACTGILFNHESPLRPERFVTRKIVSTACRIAGGGTERLALGNLAIIRDWGWAPEYVEAMWKMLQRDAPDDYVIATGQSHSLEEFVERVFAELGLDWRLHVDIDETLFRPTDLAVSRANPAKANAELAWQARTGMAGIVTNMIAASRASPKP